MLKLKLPYFCHLMRRTDSLKKTLMLGKTEGRRLPIVLTTAQCPRDLEQALSYVLSRFSHVRLFATHGL